MLVLPRLPPMHSFSVYYNFSQNKGLLPIGFFVLWVSSEILVDHKSETPVNIHIHLAFTEAIKLFVTLGLYSARRKYFRYDWFPSLDHCRHDNEDQPLSNISLSLEGSHESFTPRNIRIGEVAEIYPPSAWSYLGDGQSSLSILVISALYSLRAYAISQSREHIDPLAQYLVIPAASLCSLFVLRTFFCRTCAPQLWYAALLQFCGVFIVRSGLISRSSDLPYLSLLASALSISFSDSLVDIIYKSHRPSSFDAINLLIFAFGCLAHLSLYIFSVTFLGTRSHSFGSHAQLIALTLSCLSEAGRDISALYVIYYYDVILESITTVLASNVVLFFLIAGFLNEPGVFIGCLLALTAAGIFVFSTRQTAEEGVGSECVTRPRYPVVFALVLVVYLLYVSFAMTHENVWTSRAPRPQWGSTSEPKQGTCRRRPLSSHLHRKTPLENYDRFDNILLVVFFSHARYGANLDYHREVYSDYFPNILYIGPASREDAGFDHSYDIFVDSYHSDEDLSDPSYYKMAGRMAHHMLYTALQEHGCYDGYLWVPFDTLLNIPRLEKFNQELFWYHSPWGLPVFNPAQDNSLDLGLHAPPVNVSPDPSINLTETWRGWGPDWWWGDPHVGVGVCMEAFQKVPAHLRERLAAFTNGETRLIGGSADTMYIPGRHRRIFMEVLGLFLETTCFLEIAAPTTLHLVAPHHEPILFVEHWWIYQPPFNVSFVRQKWEEGYEVDTFHTFHWGERDSDDVWRANYENVVDIRRMLRDSAERQRIIFPVRNETLAG
ncbi:hypothetical protein DEU56DRAFT_978911 [Suillus clintonianus]|uniref:uncharacterized protein n=1 Tax=Suillus clintonianus TaxID=1904413 RepID=UPI001B883D0A|nr:uncharacterized protein DEU56DRAFT_978911 [Suillus clintonianus]KAG2145871.1 hypothetical protein DEU56DRAFT_978911 [Suillus clintonianus]